MDRQRPLVQLVMGAAACAFAAVWLPWLLLDRRELLADLPAAAGGQAEAVQRLAAQHLTGAGAVAFSVLHLAAAGLLGALVAASGLGLLLFCRWARWAAVFAGSLSALAAAGHTLAVVFFLTPAGAVVKLSPFFLDAAAVLFAVVLVGTMFLPEMTMAYAGEVAAPAPPEPAPPPPS